IGPSVSGVAALVDIAPDEPGAAVGDAVHQFEIVREICHARIVDLVSNATDVQLRKMMIWWLLQGPTPSPTSVMNSRRLMSLSSALGHTSMNRGLSFSTANLNCRCPLWVKSGRCMTSARCPLYPNSGTGRDVR